MQITKNIHALKIPFQIPVAPDITVDRFVYLYLICTDRIWLIDTGVAAAVLSIGNLWNSSGAIKQEA